MSPALTIDEASLPPLADAFQKQQDVNAQDVNEQDVSDVVIAGAGPAGLMLA